jgi:hypothetical protein
MYAQLPVFKYQTFDQGGLSFSNVPVLPPRTSPVRYFGAVTDLPPKSEEKPEEISPESDTAEKPAESTPEPTSDTQGQHE